MIRICAVLVTAVSFLRADSVSLDWSSGLLLDQVMAQARENPKLGEAAFHFLRVVGEDRKDEITPELLSAFTYRKDLFPLLLLSDPRVRAQAFERIGRLATPEALAYLESIDLARFPSVEDQDIIRSISLGIFLAQATRIPDAQRRWEFYAETLRHPPEGLGRDGPLAMAYRGLCSEGALGFLPDIEAHVRRENTQTAEHRFQRCKEMMHLVATHASRAAGLEAALYTNARVPEEDLRGWAMQELGDIHTQESRAILERFVRAAEAKLGPSPETRKAAMNQDPMLWSDFKIAESKAAKLDMILSPPIGARDRRE